MGALERYLECYGYNYIDLKGYDIPLREKKERKKKKQQKTTTTHGRFRDIRIHEFLDLWVMSKMFWFQRIHIF